MRHVLMPKHAGPGGTHHQPPPILALLKCNHLAHTHTHQHTYIKTSLEEHFQSSIHLASVEAPCPGDAESYVATAAPPPPPTRDANRIRYKDGRGDRLEGGGGRRIRGEERGSGGGEAKLTTKALVAAVGWVLARRRRRRGCLVRLQPPEKAA